MYIFYGVDILNRIGSMEIFNIIVRAIVLMTALPIHESAHAYVAAKLGDPTAKNLGRISLNPLVHLDLFGSVLMLFTGFGWAKPVPVVTRNFKHFKRDSALTSLAGPLSNYLLALVLMVVLKIINIISFKAPSMTLYAITQMLYIMLSINISLAVFNMLPIPPLDGSRLYFAFLPGKLYYYVIKYEQYILIVFFALMFFTNILSAPLIYLSNKLMLSIDFLTAFLGRIW